MADPTRPWTLPPPPSPGSLRAVLDFLLGNTPPPIPQAPSLPVPGTDLQMPAPPELAALMTRQAPAPTAEAPWFVNAPMTGRQFGENVAQDVPDTAHMLWQLGLRADEVLPMMAKGLLGSLSSAPVPGSEELAGAVKEGMAATWGDPLRYFYETPGQFATDVVDPTDLGIQGTGALAMAAPFISSILRPSGPGRAVVRQAETEWAGLRGFYSRAYRAAKQLPEVLKVNQVRNALERLGAPPEELAFINLSKSLEDLRASLPGGGNATITGDEVAQLIKDTTPQFTRREEVTREGYVPGKLPLAARPAVQALGGRPTTPEGWLALKDELRRQMTAFRQEHGNSWDWPPQLSRRFQQLDRAYWEAEKATHPPTLRLADPGPPYNMIFNEYVTPGVEDYQLSSWNLPDRPTTPEELGFSVGRKSSLSDPYRDEAATWVIYDPSGRVDAEIPVTEAQTPQEAMAAYTARYGTQADESFPSVHLKNPNIFHIRSGVAHWIPEGEAPVPFGAAPGLGEASLLQGEPGNWMHEGQIDAYNAGRKSGFAQHPLVEGNLSRMVVRENGIDIPYEPLPVDEATALAEQYRLQGKDVRVEPMRQPEPVVRRQAVDLELEQLWKEDDALSQKAQAGRLAPEEVARQYQIKQRISELDSTKLSELHGGDPKVGHIRRPPISQGTIEDLIAKIMVIDAAEQGLGWAGMTSGAAQERFYGHGLFGEGLQQTPRLYTADRVGSFPTLDEAQAVLDALGDPGLRVERTSNGWSVTPLRTDLNLLDRPAAGQLRGSSTPHRGLNMEDVPALVGPDAGRALSDPLHAISDVSVRRVEDLQLDPAWVQGMRQEADDWYGAGTPAADEHFQGQVEARAHAQATNRFARPLEPYEQVTVTPTDDPARWGVTVGLTPPSYNALVEEGLQVPGVTRAAAEEAATAMYDPARYRALRQQFEAMGFAPEDARRLAEDPDLVAQPGGALKPVDYATWQQDAAGQVTRAEESLKRREALGDRYDAFRDKLLAQGMPEEQATARANKQFKVQDRKALASPQDLQQARADLDELRRAYEADLAQMEWGRGEAQAVAPQLPYLRELPTQIARPDVSPGFGNETRGFRMGHGLERTAWRLATSYDERYAAKWQKLVDAYLPGATLERGMVRARAGEGTMAGGKYPWGESGRRITLPEELRARLLAPEEEGGGLPLFMLAPFLLSAASDDLGGD